MPPSLANPLRAQLRPPRAASGCLTPFTRALLEALAFGALLPALVLLLAPAPLREPAAALLVLCPLVLGLKHGIGMGAWGAALAAGAMALAWSWVAEDMASYPKASAIAGLLVGLVAGAARERSDARLKQLSTVCDYHRTRLAQQQSEHRLLRLSHDELQRKLAVQCSLRTSLERVRHEIEQVLGRDAAETRRLGARMLDILRDLAPLNAAALFLCLDDGTLAPEAAATLGGAAPRLDAYPDLPARLDAPGAGDTADLLAPGAPLPLVVLRDFGGRLRGVLVVEDMAFDAVSPETFDRLRVLARSLANGLARRAQPVEGARDLRQLRSELQAAVAEGRHTGLPLAVLACECPAGLEAAVFVQRLVHASRCLDRSWEVRKPQGASTVVQLLPLTDGPGAQAFGQRLERLLHEEFPALCLDLRAWAFVPGEAGQAWHGLAGALDGLEGRAVHEAGGAP